MRKTIPVIHGQFPSSLCCNAPTPVSSADSVPGPIVSQLLSFLAAKEASQTSAASDRMGRIGGGDNSVTMIGCSDVTMESRKPADKSAKIPGPSANVHSQGNILECTPAKVVFSLVCRKLLYLENV